MVFPQTGQASEGVFAAPTSPCPQLPQYGAPNLAGEPQRGQLTCASIPADAFICSATCLMRSISDWAALICSSSDLNCMQVSEMDG